MPTVQAPSEILDHLKNLEVWKLTTPTELTSHFDLNRALSASKLDRLRFSENVKSHGRNVARGQLRRLTSTYNTLVIKSSDPATYPSFATAPNDVTIPDLLRQWEADINQRKAAMLEAGLMDHSDVSAKEGTYQQPPKPFDVLRATYEGAPRHHLLWMGPEEGFQLVTTFATVSKSVQIPRGETPENWEDEASE